MSACRVFSSGKGRPRATAVLVEHVNQSCLQNRSGIFTRNMRRWQSSDSKTCKLYNTIAHVRVRSVSCGLKPRGVPDEALVWCERDHRQPVGLSCRPGKTKSGESIVQRSKSMAACTASLLDNYLHRCRVQVAGSEEAEGGHRESACACRAVRQQYAEDEDSCQGYDSFS